MSKPCPNCDGFGWEVAPAPCPRCEGHGCAYCNDGAVPEQVPCRMCGGSGVVEVPEDPNEVEQRLREIEERVSKATAPPWSDDKGILWIPSFCGMLEAGVGVPRGADATFCAHAREDVPWLLSLLREREEEVRALRHLLNEIECGTDDIREGLRGCGDHSCMVKKPLGMATNGGCRCVERNTLEVRVLLGRALRKAARLEEENRRLRKALDWLVHLNRGVSRGGGAPSMVEWEDAWQNAEWLVRGERP